MFLPQQFVALICRCLRLFQELIICLKKIIKSIKLIANFIFPGFSFQSLDVAPPYFVRLKSPLLPSNISLWTLHGFFSSSCLFIFFLISLADWNLKLSYHKSLSLLLRPFLEPFSVHLLRFFDMLCKTDSRVMHGMSEKRKHGRVKWCSCAGFLHHTPLSYSAHVQGQRGY